MRFSAKAVVALACVICGYGSAFGQSPSDRLPEVVYRIDRVDCPIKGPPEPTGTGRVQPCLQDLPKSGSNNIVRDPNGVFGGPNSLVRRPLGIGVRW
jgi:hypothetical protein